MRVVIKLFAHYREGRFKVQEGEFPLGTTAQDIIASLELEKVSPLGVLMVNGRHEEPQYVLQENDEVAIFPKIGGG